MKIAPLSALVVLLCFFPAFAEEGPYFGAGFVYNNPLSSDIGYLESGGGLLVKLGYDFGQVALEGSLMGSDHNDVDPGFGSADFDGFSLDLRVFVSHAADPNQLYFLVGFGSYSLDEFNPSLNASTSLEGGGFNVGAGLERFLNPNVALNLGFLYRFIRYDEIEIDGLLFSLDPSVDGDTFTIEAGVNFYF